MEPRYTKTQHPQMIVLVFVPAIMFLWFSNSTLMFLCGSGLGGRGQRKPSHSGNLTLGIRMGWSCVARDRGKVPGVPSGL